MANIIRNQRLIDNNRRCVSKIVFISDGATNEANTLLIDAGSLAYSMNANNRLLGVGTDRKLNYRTTIRKILAHSASNNGIVRIQWQSAQNTEIVLFGRQVTVDYEFDSFGDPSVVTNPDAPTNGNIVFSTAGYAAGEGFTVVLDQRKNGSDYDQGQAADPKAFNL